MNYTLHQLQVFLKVVETKNVTRASEELFMTQPAVSIQLKKFQDQFEIPLTEVIGRQLHITEFGYEIAYMVERALVELQAIQYKTREYTGLLTGRIKIASASTGKYVIPYFISEFLEIHKGIDLMLDVTNKSKVVEQLKSNEVDFALVSILPENMDLEEELLVENTFYLVGSSPNYTTDQPLIYRETGSATRLIMENYFQRIEKRGLRKLELTSNEAVTEAVVAGLGYSILPLIGMKHSLLRKELHIIEAEGLPLKTHWRLIWLKSKRLSPVAMAYLQFVRDSKERILNTNFEWLKNYK
ncbi:MAG: LysR family transcriptional regulator [Bacteroidales bacterium]|nr:LysR family transcriptional regulator [Bacteroidales bacterium]